MLVLLIVSSPLWLCIGGIVHILLSHVISEVKEKKKLESDSARNHLDITNIFYRICERLSLKNKHLVKYYSLKEKLDNLDTFIRKLDDEDMSRFKGQCIDEIPALLQIQKTMLTPKFNVENETLMELIELVVDSLFAHYKEFDKMKNIDLKCELESLKSIKAKRENSIKHVSDY